MSIIDTEQWQLYEDPEGFICIRHPADWHVHTSHVRSRFSRPAHPQPNWAAPSTKQAFTFAPAMDVSVRPDNGGNPSLGVLVRCIYPPKPWNFFHPMRAPNMVVSGLAAYRAADEEAPWVIETTNAHYEMWCWPPDPFPRRRGYIPFGASMPAPPARETLREWTALTAAILSTFRPGPSAG